MYSNIKIMDENIHYFYEDNPNNLPVVLFIHGYNDSCKTVMPLIFQKNRKYVIYGLDLPGCGLSTNNKPITLEYYNNILKEFIHRLFGDKSIILLTHSMGSVLGLNNYSLNNVTNLIMLAPLNYALVDNVQQKEQLHKWLLPNDSNDILDSYLNLVYKPTETFKDRYKLISKDLEIKISENHNKYAFLVNNQILNINYLTESIKLIFNQSKQYYIVYTENDKYVLPSQINKIQSEFPRNQYIELKNCGHAILYQKAYEINELINSLIK
ncbi:alpha/beta fold hydrolase [Mycoplasmopsis felifaucium]|uniref:alpha/beta fold hydrolase n=1 Tax=Mycoplasmopsis felifaucium TaxID=35768 RepID=UPI00068B3DDB|nr:alpha/beta fold hydrolase [Mycoplasmopsis felifaucium]